MEEEYNESKLSDLQFVAKLMKDYATLQSQVEQLEMYAKAREQGYAQIALLTGNDSIDNVLMSIKRLTESNDI